MTRPSTPTKAELYEMLAAAVRNTQPQPVQPAPVRNVQPDPKHQKLSNTRPAANRTAKIKGARAPGRRKRQPR